MNDELWAAIHKWLQYHDPEFDEYVGDEIAVKSIYTLSNGLCNCIGCAGLRAATREQWSNPGHGEQSQTS